LAGEGQNITPARFVTPDMPFDHEHISKQVRATLQQAAELLEITGYARIDAFVRIYEDGRAETLIIEVNSLPGMTPATCIFHQCAINGYKPYEFIDQILQFGAQRNQQQNKEAITE
jgi:D-alanine-D-alanine ligase